LPQPGKLHPNFFFKLASEHLELEVDEIDEERELAAGDMVEDDEMSCERVRKRQLSLEAVT
jgi:hypothetical protein